MITTATKTRALLLLLIIFETGRPRKKINLSGLGPHNVPGPWSGGASFPAIGGQLRRQLKTPLPS